MRSAAAVMTPRPVTTPTHVTVFRNIAPQLANGYRCYNRRAITSQSGQRGFATESLEHAIQLINKFIFEHEQRRQRQRAKRLEGNGVVEVEVQPISKPITFKASARTEKLVKVNLLLPSHPIHSATRQALHEHPKTGRWGAESNSCRT